MALFGKGAGVATLLRWSVLKGPLCRAMLIS